MGIGKDLALLITESGDSYKELMKRMHCVKEYVAMKDIENNLDSTLKKMCLDKGRKEASRLIWGLSRNPQKLKDYLEKAKSFDHWKMAYKMGYSAYLREVMHLAEANAPTN